MKPILNFLRELEKNNNRDWFQAHKPEYQEARNLFEQKLAAIIAGLAPADRRISGIRASDAIFRIYRDTRFAHDKTPYKNNFGAHISPGGKNGGEPGYYFHVQPGESFISGGIYMPSPEKLKAIRKEIYLFPEDFTALIESSWFRKDCSFFEDDKLKKPPAGFPADFPLIDYLKFKHYCPWIPLTDDMLTSSGLTDRIIQHFISMKEFNDFIYRAIED